MNRIALAAAALALAGCPPQPTGKNPPQVWEALNGSELMVKLTPIEPAPF
jgi:hypothetical protein